MAKICPVCETEYTDESVFCPADGSTLRSTESTENDLVGQVIADRYLVQKKLGEGGMGAVYLAKHVRLPKQAAIKVLRPEMLADSASVARFNREAANASQIEHEGVARVFDFGETSSGMVYLAMEYVAGRSLRDVLDQDGALTLAKAVTVVRQVADGLDAAHRLGIVHRDLKPDNILVAIHEETGEIHCKIVDFGIAKAVGAPSGQTQLTRTGMVVGTPEFMSPEQLLAGDLDHRSDVYALGLVAYQALTLDLPFDLRAPDRGMTARLVSQPRGLAAVRPDLPWPLSLQKVFDEALDRDPDARTPSAGAFADAFEAAAADAGVHVGRRGGTTRVTAVQNAPAARAATAAAPAASAGAPVAAAGAASAVATKKGGSGALIGIAAAVLILGGGGAWYALKGGGAASGTATGDSTGIAAVAETPDVQVGAPGGVNTGGGAARPTGGAGDAARGAAVAGATPAGGGSPPNPGAGTVPVSNGAAAAGAAVGNAVLDSITRELDPAMGEPSAATVTAALSALRALMPKLQTASDSTWAYIRVLEAHMLRDDERSACVALQAANRLAGTMKQAEVLRGYEGMLTCK